MSERVSVYIATSTVQRRARGAGRRRRQQRPADEAASAARPFAVKAQILTDLWSRTKHVVVAQPVRDRGPAK